MGTQTDLSSSGCLPLLGVRTAMHGDHAVLAPYGEIDFLSTETLDQALAGLPEGVASVVVNMAEVTFMDSAGLHFLNRLRVFGRQRGIPVKAVHFARQPRQVLEVDGSHHLTEPDDPVERVGAVAALQPAASGDLHLATTPAPEPAHQARPEAEEVERLREEVAQLQQALQSRPEIDQARGMIMALGPCSSQAAWDALVHMSQHTNTKLRDIATALVATTEGHPLSAGLQCEIDQVFGRLRASAP